ncbi:TlpA family protein disulfide reductase [Aquimarina rhabdastrellae]
MRKTFCILLVLISNIIFGQTEFRIHLKSDVDVDKVSISSFNLSKKFSSVLKNGIATIKIPSNSSDQYSIFVNSKRIDGWFNSGNIAVFLELKNKDLSISKTINTPVYERQVRYFSEYRKFLKDKSIGKDFIKNTITQNDQDAFILVPINHYLKLSQNNDKELKFIEQILNKQPKSTKEHSIFKMISSRLEILRKIKQIDLNEYSLIKTNGEISKIKRQSNKKHTVLDFWFTSCPPCIKEHKTILAKPNMFNDLNAELIGISTDKNQEKWVSYLRKNNIKWKNYRIGKINLDRDLGIWSFPTYIILDKENKIIGSYSNIEDTIIALKK